MPRESIYTKEVRVNLTPRMLAKLDRASASMELTRADAIRHALRQWLSSAEVAQSRWEVPK